MAPWPGLGMLRERSEKTPTATAVPPPGPMPNSARPLGLIQRYQEELQARHYARRTVDIDVQWLRRFLRFHQLRHPR